MGRYSGQKCAVCSKRFGNQEDIVVCPVCGTPHHRQCWIDYGGCRNANLHGTDFQWKPQATASDHPDFNEKTDMGEICPVCGKNNPPHTLFCPGCGTPLGAGPAQQGQQQGPGGRPFSVPFASGTDGQQTIQGVPAREVAAVVQFNAVSYIPKFLKMERKKVPVSFNWAALLISPFWFIYRKMYVFGGILLALMLAVGIVTAPAVNAAYDEINTLYSSMAQSETSQEQLSAQVDQLLQSANVQTVLILNTANFILMVALGFAANPLYRRSVVRKAKKLREQEEPLEREKLLKRWGGINIWAAGVAYLLYRMVGLAVSYFLF